MDCAHSDKDASSESALWRRELLYTVVGGGGIIVYSCERRQGYCIQLWEEAGLLHTVVGGGRVVACSSSERQGYCIQLSKKAELLYI